MQGLMFTPYPWFSTFSFLLILAGFAVRRTHRDLHVALMCSGMGLDLIIVLLLEFSRDAVGVALGSSLTPFQLTHVIASTFAGAFYIPVFVLGYKRWRNPSAPESLRTWHLRLGYLALACRAVGFLFMFSIVGRNA